MEEIHGFKDATATSLVTCPLMLAETGIRMKILEKNWCLILVGWASNSDHRLNNW